ncbi:MAG TPA: protein yceI precursor [Gemmatimonadetes bacterium]|jgi:polyisoprenoid-binding protein YceI|nr:protein yceI precursor [Gemmatimonadota bacterium]
MIRGLSILLALAPAPALAGAQSALPAQASKAGASVNAPSTWKIDPTHSELSFTIRHMVSKVRGQFDAWSGTILADPADWNTASVEVVAQTSTIDTNNERRDADLRSDNHFDADANPTVTFKSTKVTRFASDSVTVAGNLTMHGITRPVVLRGHLNGITGVPGKRRAGFEAETTINRKDFNMTWNRIVEGSSMVGDEVRIEIDIAAVEQPQ